MRNHGGCKYFHMGSVNFAHSGSSTELIGLMCFYGTIFLVCLRFEIALSRLPLNERQLYTHVLDPGKGRLVFLVTLRPCWGVSISDIETATLERPDERDTVEKKLVSYFLSKFMQKEKSPQMLALNHTTITVQ